jgi:hypothetical protein
MVKIDEQTIRSLLSEQGITGGTIRHDDGLIGFSLLAERLTAGINHVIDTACQRFDLETELNKLRTKYEEDCGELDDEMARLVGACKHPSQHEHEELEFTYVCNICGGLVEEDE